MRGEKERDRKGGTLKGKEIRSKEEGSANEGCIVYRVLKKLESNIQRKVDR
jgi:hypothetical protein